MHVASRSYQAKRCMMGDTRPEHTNYVWIVSGLAVSAPDEIEIAHGCARQTQSRWPCSQVLTRVASRCKEHSQLLELDLHAIVAKYINGYIRGEHAKAIS